MVAPPNLVRPLVFLSTSAVFWLATGYGISSQVMSPMLQSVSNLISTTKYIQPTASPVNRAHTDFTAHSVQKQQPTASPVNRAPTGLTAHAAPTASPVNRAPTGLTAHAANYQYRTFGPGTKASPITRTKVRPITSGFGSQPRRQSYSTKDTAASHLNCPNSYQKQNGYTNSHTTKTKTTPSSKSFQKGIRQDKQSNNGHRRRSYHRQNKPTARRATASTTSCRHHGDHIKTS